MAASERIDVLAVMDESAGELRIANRDLDAAELDEARAAVAELIEAADYVARYVANYSALTYSPVACGEANDRLRAALARVSGEPA